MQQFDLGTSLSSSKAAFVKEGIWHIWTGYDHILFLIALLLPGVLRRRAAGWEPRRDVRLVLGEVLKTVTAFTLAHSITLSLAALGIVHLPARFVEMAIAASVIVAALNNIVPVWCDRSWLVAFGFGLLHGFGFANALTDLGLHRGALAKTLFGFNAGVEIGQLAIVALFLPLALSLRNREFYRHRLLPAGSVAIGLVAAAWFVERLLDYKL
jgi:hydrogenase/urease accessory protein HupE